MARLEPGAEDHWPAKCLRLEQILGQYSGLLIAFSGGVDSGVLLHAAQRVLGDRALGLIADSPSLPREELREAVEFAAAIGARIEIVATQEGEDERYQRNQGDRCYWCKSHLFDAMQRRSLELGVQTLAFGEITDDLRDDRPGARAAQEREIVAPLRLAGFSKEDVRRYAREYGLSLAEKPSSACLASRLPVGTRVTPERLARIEICEATLRRLGLRQLRVRDLGAHARVEVGKNELSSALHLAENISRILLQQGFLTNEIAEYIAPSERAH